MLAAPCATQQNYAAVCCRLEDSTSGHKTETSIRHIEKLRLGLGLIISPARNCRHLSETELVLLIENHRWCFARTWRCMFGLVLNFFSQAGHWKSFGAISLCLVVSWKLAFCLSLKVFSQKVHFTLWPFLSQ